MSHSPRATQNADALAEYRQGWQATMQLLRSGHSFSGHERNCVFMNQTNGHFANASAISGLDFDDDGRAIGVTDWDHDGDLDLWLGNRTGPRLRLMRNESSEVTVQANQFVAFQLQGTRSNRDAIGARVEVLFQPAADGHVPPPLVQTLYAGDAYLSQSSKSLHFGLGTQATPQAVTVRWPGGSTERFEHIAANRRYRLVEGSGTAQLWEPARGPLVLAPHEQAPPPAANSSQTFFANRLPLPTLPYIPLPTGPLTHLTGQGRPQLVLFWASWCVPCLQEMEWVATHYDDLKTQGVDVVAISLDGLDKNHTTTAQDAQRLLDRLAWPWPAGVATPTLLEKLEFTTSILFNRTIATQIPLSLLIDADGSIAAIYRGPLSIQQLQRDLSHVNDTLVSRQQLASPLPGRWLNPPRTLLLRAVARQFALAGYEEDHASILAREATDLDRLRDAATAPEQRQQLARRIATANFELAVALVSAGDYTEATEHFRRTLELQPDHVEALTNLGSLLARAKQWPRALPLLARAVELAPEEIPPRVNLAAALSSAGEFQQAVPVYERLCELEPNNADFAARLGRARLETQQIASAAAAFEQALQLNPQDARSLLSLAWLRSTAVDDQYRNGPQALQLAQRLLQLSSERDPLAWDVLAATQAECQDFVAAQQSIDSALRLLGNRQPTFQAAIEGRRTAYQQNQPYRDRDAIYP